MVRTRKAIYVGNQKVQRRYIGNKLIFENLGNDKDKVSGVVIFTDKADNSVVHVEIDGKSYQHTGRGKNLNSLQWAKDSIQEASFSAWDYRFDTYNEVKAGEVFTATIWINPQVKPTRTMLEFGEEGKPYNSQILGNIIEVGESGYATVTATALTDGWVRQVIRHVTSGTTVNRVNYKEAQLERGSQGTPYEAPYVIPEPTPDHPIEIHNLNDFDVVSSTEKLSEGQLEEYNYDTEYENIYKINLLLDEPLRSVGDVKDRLFRDSDGLWKIERNIEVTGTEDGTQSIADAYSTYDVPMIEALPVEYQNKLSNLRSFQDSNYVYTVFNNTDILPIVAKKLKPTLHATFKTKGWYDDYKTTLLK